MAESGSDPGAPVPKDTIDPELIKLARSKTRVGLVTAAGVVILAALFVVRLNADRRFGGSSTEATKVTAQDIVDGKVDLDRYVSVEAEPFIAGAVRATQGQNQTGLRVAPVRGTADRLWIVLPGDGWEAPSGYVYKGRLRKLDDLPFAAAIDTDVTEHPRPVFAPPAAIRAAFASGTVDGIAVADNDRVAFDVVDPNVASVIVSFVDRLPSINAWTVALGDAGIKLGATAAQPLGTDRARFDVAMSVADVTHKLADAKLFATRVEPVTRHDTTTWGSLKGSPPGGFVVGSATIPDAQIDLIGVFAARGTPHDAYAIITGERPEDYWYVLPITMVLVGIGLVFAWALVRAVRRDLLSPRAT